MKKTGVIHVLLRIFLGVFFAGVALEKLLSPYENFLYVIEGYAIVPLSLARFAARTVPWVEFFLGIFLVLGLWLKPVLRVVFLILGAFIFLLGQSIVRNLPMKDCGCYGELLSVPLHVSIGIDLVLLAVVAWLLKSFEKTSRMSLDRYFESQNS